MNPLDLAADAPWKRRFRAPVVASTELAARNPARGMAVTNRSGVYQLYAWDVATGELRQITDKAAGVVFGGISPDGAYIYYHDDTQGDEIGHYVRVPFEGGPPEDITPDMPPYASFSLSESLSQSAIGFTVADRDGFRMMMMPRNASGALQSPRVLYHSERLSFGPQFTFDGDYAVIATTERGENTDQALMAFYLADASAQQTVKVLEEDEGSISPVGFAPLAGDTRLLAFTDVSGYPRPLIWDVATGDRTDLPLATLDGSVYPLDWSPDGRRLLLNHLAQAVYQLYVYDLEWSTLDKLNHPPGTVSSAYFVPDSDEIFANWQDSTQPPQVVVLDAATGKVRRTVLQAGEAPAGQQWRSVSFDSSGGARIQAWLGTPDGKGPYPTIVHMHGGPTSVMTDVFSPSIQTWIDHGFAVLSVNYRGSTTFGREFQHAILGMLGVREVDDMAAAYQWLVDNGVAQADSVLLTGGSYGGYLTLQGLGRRPDLWAGGMAQVAIADWALMYEDQAETLRGYQRSLFGGTPDELPEQTRISSPISYADDLRAPVLVIQGHNDTRCPARQMRAYEEKLASLGKQIDVHWFDAGHGARAMAQQVEHMELMLRWAYRVLG
jgi:dipeptidyl aminopeptidase/acylaminoacyl peptidase